MKIDTKVTQEFLDQIYDRERIFYSKRDNCGPAVLDFIDWAKENKNLDLERIKGEVKLKDVVYDKADFTKEMRDELVRAGYKFNFPDDRKEFILKSKYKDLYYYSPHYWAFGNNTIYDPAGLLQFGKLPLSSYVKSAELLPNGKLKIIKSSIDFTQLKLKLKLNNPG